MHSYLTALLWPCLVAATQHVLSENTFGTLRRYNISDKHVQSSLSDILSENDVDVWHYSSSRIDIYEPPNTKLPVSLLRFNHTTTYIDPVPPIHTTQTDWNLTSLTNTTFHEAYHPLHEIDQFLYDLAATYPNLTRVIPLGHSALGREMMGLSISNSTAVNKKSFVIMGAQHAREWVATAAALYISHALVSNTSEAYSLQALLDHYDFHIIPVPNPDGYVHTWETDRFWYKNRMVLSPEAKCVGLDMNRNWGYKWKPQPTTGFVDSNKKKDKKKKKEPEVDPCSHWYPGKRPFQAPEVNNIANYVATLPNAWAFVDLRAYGQMLSSPYSYNCNRMPKDAEDQLEAALGAVRALRLTHGAAFAAGSLCSMLYEAPGNVIDWMYGREYIKYTYAAHLRDTGTYGFSLPAAWIRPTGEETAKMIEYLAKFIQKPKA